MAERTPTETTSWRELAVARSLDPARVRAEQRVQRFLDAAMELMQASPEREFTVQEVVERSGQSLRSFYQYFAGKHELLLALFEESVRSSPRSSSAGSRASRIRSSASTCSPASGCSRPGRRTTVTAPMRCR